MGLGLLRGEELGHMLETGIALAIAAVPEGLPAVSTVALATWGKSTALSSAKNSGGPIRRPTPASA